MSLAKDFPRVWNGPRTVPLERKRLIALLLEDVTLLNQDEVTVHVRFRGGKRHSFTVPRPLPMSRIRKTRPEVVAALDELLETCNDRGAAERLNELGHRNWKGAPFTIKKVALVRQSCGLRSRFERLRARGFLTGAELAERFGVSITTVHTWGRAGLLQRELYGNRKRCLYAPHPQTTVAKGAGGRYPKPPKLIAAPTTEQETV